MRLVGQVVGLVCLCATVLAQAPAPMPPPSNNADEVTRPNILLLIIDDMGRDKLACYGIGDPDTMPYTPNIDRLVDRGVRFENYYTNPICSPTRAQIITGRHGFRTGVQRAIRPYQPGDEALPYEEVILPEVLEQVGYAHSQVGKWHLGSVQLDGSFHALNSGWDYTVGPQGNPNSRGQSYERWEQQENGIASWREGYLTSATVDDAIARIKAMPEPWLNWVAFNAGHGPLHVPPADLHYQDPNAIAGDKPRMYQAMIEAVDTELGRLFASMPPKVLARTTVILVTDNGSDSEVIVPPLPSHAGKGSLLEGGVHVPLIISGFSVPKVNRGGVATGLASSVDLFATIVDLGGAELPADRTIDGTSLRPMLYDLDARVRFFALAERYERTDIVGQAMLTNGRYKVIRNAQYGVGSVPEQRFFFLENAPPGRDGMNLCPCPSQLEGQNREWFYRLETRLFRLLTSP